MHNSRHKPDDDRQLALTIHYLIKKTFDGFRAYIRGFNVRIDNKCVMLYGINKIKHNGMRYDSINIFVENKLVTVLMIDRTNINECIILFNNEEFNKIILDTMRAIIINGG